MENYLLTNKNTRVFNVDLATAVGLNEAIVLQQIQYWIEIKQADKSKYTDAYHNGCFWVYNTYQSWQDQFPFWCLRTIKTIFKNLENKGILITGNFNKYGYDKTKWYTIDYEILNKIVAETLENTHSAKVAPSKVQELHDGECKSCTTNTKDYTENTTEITIKCIKGSASEKLKADDGFDKNILDKQILKGFHALGYYQGNLITDGLKVINYYYKKFYDTFGEEHPRLSNDAMKGVIERYCSTYSIVEGFNDLDTYQCLIDKHFETYYKNCDYNICHFMTDGIRDNRYYETLY